MKTLTLNDRFNILSFCPERSDFAELEVTIPLSLKVALQHDEEKYVNPDESGGVTIVKEALDVTFDLDFTEAEEEFITTRLKALNEAKALTKQYMSLYRIFVLNS